MHLYSTRSATPPPPPGARLALSPSSLRPVWYALLPTRSTNCPKSFDRRYSSLSPSFTGRSQSNRRPPRSAPCQCPLCTGFGAPAACRRLCCTPQSPGYTSGSASKHHLLHLEGAHARPHVADEQSESRKVSLSLAARGLDPVVKACGECEMRHSCFLDNLACRLKKLRGIPSPPKPWQGKSVLFQLHPFCYIPRQLLENADLVRDAWPRAALRLISSGTRTPSGSQSVGASLLHNGEHPRLLCQWPRRHQGLEQGEAQGLGLVLTQGRGQGQRPMPQGQLFVAAPSPQTNPPHPSVHWSRAALRRGCRWRTLASTGFSAAGPAEY